MQASEPAGSPVLWAPPGAVTVAILPLCVVCLQAAANALPPLPCHHACCAHCLHAFLAVAVPSTPRCGSIAVRCSGQEGALTRCRSALPASLTAPYVVVAPAEPAPVRSGRVDRLTAAYLKRHARRCPTCGIATQRISGCAHVCCVCCDTHWCHECGRRMASCRCDHEPLPLPPPLPWLYSLRHDLTAAQKAGLAVLGILLSPLWSGAAAVVATGYLLYVVLWAAGWYLLAYTFSFCAVIFTEYHPQAVGLPAWLQGPRRWVDLAWHVPLRLACVPFMLLASLLVAPYLMFHAWHYLGPLPGWLLPGWDVLLEVD